MRPAVSVQSLPGRLPPGVSVRGQYGFWLLRSCTQCVPFVAFLSNQPAVRLLRTLPPSMGILPLRSMATAVVAAEEPSEPIKRVTDLAPSLDCQAALGWARSMITAQ